MIIVYMMVVWFGILLFSDKDYSLCAIIILLCSAINIILVDVIDFSSALSYVDDRGFSVLFDGLTALALTAIYGKDKLAIKMSALLIFSVICHCMIIYDLTVNSSLITNFFYAWYDELIITIGILQMAIASDGITSALGNIQTSIQRASFYFWCYTKNLSPSKKREAKT